MVRQPPYTARVAGNPSGVAALEEGRAHPAEAVDHHLQRGDVGELDHPRALASSDAK
jgi:hypothetical protein